MLPHLSVIIPTKNEQDYLPRLLESLKKQTYTHYKIIVADADSTDNTRQIAREYGAEIVPGGLPFAGRNNGAEKAIKDGTDLLVFIDADIILPHEDFLHKAIAEFYARKLDIAGTMQVPYDIVDGKVRISHNFTYHLIYRSANIAMLAFEKTKKPMFQVCMFVKPIVHQTIGGFKPLEFAEDSFYARQARQAGFNFGILRRPGKVLISPRRYRNKGFFKSGAPYFLANYVLGRTFEHGKAPRKYFDD